MHDAAEAEGQHRRAIYGNVLIQEPFSDELRQAVDMSHAAGLRAISAEGGTMPEKTRHVLEQLPQHATVIRERMIVDREFRSLCEDHGEALEALRRWEASEDRHRRNRVDEFRNLVADLEREILAELHRSTGGRPAC